jgi:hypothetical protein
MTNTRRDIALDIVLALNLDLDRDREDYLQHVVDLDLDLARSLAQDLAHEPDLVRVRALAATLTRARDIALNFDFNFDHGRDIYLAPDLHHAAGAVDRALRSASELERLLLVGVSASVSSDSQPCVTVPLAGWRTAIAAGLLPGAERARYGEEFGSELAEIALAGGGRRAQLAYAARTVLSSTWQLRAALRSPRRRGAIQ